VAIAPIDEETGRPIETEVIRPVGTTPLEAELVPGTYLVVAEIRGYGFHEVYRLVPRPDDAIPTGGREFLSRKQSRGVVDLAAINIRPESEVIAGMAQFTGGRFLTGDDEPAGIPIHECAVSAFYLAPYEVTVADYLAVFEGLPTGVIQAGLTLDRSSALTCITFAEALDYAEQIGLRLPTEEEYEFAATEAGTRMYPWGDDGSLIRDWRFDAVGEPQFDRTVTNPPVYGLYSNVAEWTDSRRLLTLGGFSARVIPPALKQMSLNSRVVRGGPFSVAQRALDTQELRYGPRWGHSVAQNAPFRGVGFRCARSVKPRFLD
jgi:formylglycine-generating enzyme required for sulfatase activity